MRAHQKYTQSYITNAMPISNRIVLQRRRAKNSKFLLLSEFGFYWLGSITLFIVSIPFTRQILGINFALFSIIGWISVARSRRFNDVPGELLALSALTLFYAALSALHALPVTWTRFHDVTAIPQQILFAFFLPASLFIYYKLLEPALACEKYRKALARYFFSLWVITKLLTAVLDNNFSLSSVLSLSGLSNQSALAIISIALMLTTIKKPVLRVPFLAIFLALSLMSPFSQNLFFATLFIAIWTIPSKSTEITLSFLITSIAFYIYLSSSNNLGFAQQIDTNLMVRLVLILDALDGLVSSGFLGVGFGTESIKNFYMAFDNPIFFDESTAGFLHLAVHNSFATIFFRLGFLGGAIFLLFTLGLLIGALKIEKHRDRALALSGFSAFFMVTFLNPALESFFYLNAVALYISLALTLVPRTNRTRLRLPPIGTSDR